MNLLQETQRAIEAAKLSPKRITFIGLDDGSLGCTWAEFEQLANIDYNDGYGGAEVHMDLVVLFDNGSWLSRDEYDGSEWWIHNKKPRVPRSYEPLTKVLRR